MNVKLVLAFSELIIGVLSVFDGAGLKNHSEMVIDSDQKKRWQSSERQAD